MRNLAKVGAIAQELEESAPAYGLPTHLATTSGFGSLGDNAILHQAAFHLVDRTKLKICQKDMAHGFCLAIVHAKPVRSGFREIVSKRNGPPPNHMPFFFEAAILSRSLSPVTSRSNWAKDRRTLRVSRPTDDVVLKA